MARAPIIMIKPPGLRWLQNRSKTISDAIDASEAAISTSRARDSCDAKLHDAKL